MDKKLLILGLVFGAIITLPLAGFGQTTSIVPPAAERIQLFNRLRSELATLQAKLETLKLQSASVKSEIRLTKNLMRGMTDEEVKKLQELLATDPEIYPEGYQTGYFGALTHRAMMKFQKKAGLAETGEVDDRTMWKINELLTEGAGHSGKIPLGLLRAPGILRKLGFATTTPPGQDTTAPVITGVAATSTTVSSTVIAWQTNEPTTGQVYFATTTPVAASNGTKVSLDLTLTVSHVLLLGNLQASTTYYYYIKATDRAGNSATTTDASFTTLGQ
ncbi:MAG: peptidoglycan-binding protein [Candidatus Vogelbacteria bacterium]|nr:peptidoglycan-binding protein [Candidatus Vogelbacteria bacterium]